MGIYSVGIDRLREILRQRLDSKPIDPNLHTEWATGSGGELKSVIYDSLVNDFRKQLQRGEIDEGDFSRRKRSAETDAIAISRLIHMNRKETSGSRRDSSSKDLFLYVSSAPRSRRVFSIPEIANAQPRIHGKPFNMWRTRAQLFVYALHNVTHNSYDRSLDPINYLTRLKPIVAETARFPHLQQCDKCVLKGGDGDRGCNFVKLCDMVLSLDYGILAVRKQMRNLSLVRSLENYTRFQAAKPKSRVETTYIKFFKDLFAAEDLQDVVLGRIRELQRMVLIKWEFSENMPALYNYGREMIKKTHVDAVTNPIQALPTYLELASLNHRQVVDAVVRFHKQPDVTAADPLDIAYDTFVKSDKKESTLRREHEIVRCLLYMACIGISGNDLALRHAEELEREFRKTEDKADLWYLRAWALRRSARYPEADKLLTRAIRKYPDDPRMWHGRCLNSSAWWVDQTKTPITHRLARAVRDGTKAVHLYALAGEKAVEYCAVNWNNIAYLHSFEPSSGTFKLKAARRALNQMKSVLPRERWFPSYPEFFHTEANLEYHEYRAALKSTRPVVDVIDKLLNARAVIDKALEVERKPLYELLRDKIEQALDDEREKVARRAPPTALRDRAARRAR